MKSLIKTLLALQIILILSITKSAHASDTYLTIKGYGNDQSAAERDAKQQLALQLYSKVEVSEKNQQEKTDNLVTSSYSLNSSINSLPVEISNMELVSQSCEQQPCEYEFRINKTVWVNKLLNDINHSHLLATDLLANNGSSWRDLNRLNEVSRLLSKAQNAITLVPSLIETSLAPLNKIHLSLERSLNKQIQSISVTIISSPDLFASTIKAKLAQSLIVSADAHITLYIKAKTQHGRQGQQFIAKQTLFLQLFEANKPSVTVSQKILTEIGLSPNSAESAKNAAQQKIINTINNKSIFTLLH
ncbi:hypothetical protein [Shewanella pneumatophori]|uniref:OmpA-like domain-containing protein n=1 Tax=Shewanella pneumatophori TaxID=314092 RepID=A0A9X1ZE28_9GAMM|nr:hypothetical protein [Shewanella pneumatophori]MCL1137680.1 hypothetical protein [Shewanella pneumatophori]